MTHVRCCRQGARLQLQLAGASNIYIKGPDFKTKLQQDIAEQSLVPPTSSRIYLSRYLLTNNPDPCQKSSAALVHKNKN